MSIEFECMRYSEKEEKKITNLLKDPDVVAIFPANGTYYGVNRVALHFIVPVFLEDYVNELSEKLKDASRKIFDELREKVN